jgi:hypothetical protein
VIINPRREREKREGEERGRRREEQVWSSVIVLEQETKSSPLPRLTSEVGPGFSLTEIHVRPLYHHIISLT